MPKLPILQARKLIKILKKAGFVQDRVEGSHYIFFRLKDKRTISVPVHKGRDLGRGLLVSILRDADISLKEFMNMLR